MNETEKAESTMEEVKEENAIDVSKKWTEKLTPKQWKMIGLIGAVVVAFCVGVGIYNAPAQRVSRQLSLGYKYLEEQQYEEAIVAFSNAISIDESCLEAYVAGLEAYKNVDKIEELQAFYDNALTMTKNLDANVLAQNTEHVKILYLSADDVYEDDLEKSTQILEEGLQITDNNEELKKELIDQYKILAQKYTKNEDCSERLKVYDRLLELGEDSEQILNELGTCITVNVEQLIQEKKFEEAKALVNKYEGYEVNINFSELMTYIEEQEKMEAENIAFMQKVYELMKAEDYGAMHGVDGSQEAELLVSRMTEERYIYIPEDELGLNGIGAAVYKTENGGYYFFYGNLVDGERVGQGKTFINESDASTYRVFIGEWSKDTPNGTGKEIITNGIFSNSGGAFNKTTDGKLKNGLWDGQVKSIIRTSGVEFDLSYTAVEGVPTENRTSEFIENVSIQPNLKEGQWIYAYDRLDNKYVFGFVTNENRLGVTGYGK